MWRRPYSVRYYSTGRVSKSSFYLLRLALRRLWR